MKLHESKLSLSPSVSLALLPLWLLLFCDCCCCSHLFSNQHWCQCWCRSLGSNALAAGHNLHRQGTSLGQGISAEVSEFSLVSSHPLNSPIQTLVAFTIKNQSCFISRFDHPAHPRHPSIPKSIHYLRTSVVQTLGPAHP